MISIECAPEVHGWYLATRVRAKLYRKIEKTDWAKWTYVPACTRI